MRLVLPVTTLTAPCSATGASEELGPALLPQAASRQALSATTGTSRRAPDRTRSNGDTGRTLAPWAGANAGRDARPCNGNPCKRHCSLLACRAIRRIRDRVSRTGGPKLLGLTTR